MSKKLPIVAIVGRANVGKSSIFNRILKRQDSIVAREAGTTRDSVYRTVTVGKHSFWLVDTAGLKDPADEFEATIQDQIEEASVASNVIIVVVEAGTTITDEDRKVAKKALKSKKPVILVTNKSDQLAKSNTETAWERLGIKPIVATSATQNQGINDLINQIKNFIPQKQSPKDEDTLKIALLGRPNVGKSHLFNTMAKKQQAVVANLAGTTRDINRVKIKYQAQDIELLDTAGIRRSGKIERGIEKFSVLRSLQAIEQADVCLLLMDVQEHSTALDQKIAGLIKDAGKGLIIVMSKWDTLKTMKDEAQLSESNEDSPDNLSKKDKKRLAKSQSYTKEVITKNAYTRDGIANTVTYNFQFVPWAQLIFTSSVTGQNVAKIFDLALSINKRRQQVLKTSELNKVLTNSLTAHPPAGLKNRHPKPRYLVQDDINPPTFRLYGAHLEYLHWSWKRYLEKNLRSATDFDGTPIKIYMMNNVRKSGKTKKFLPKAS